jgi:hypothetical protein
MQDQDRQAEWAGEPSGSDGGRSLVVPAGIVDGLRRAVFAKIGEAGEAINESAFAKGARGAPEVVRRTHERSREQVLVN